MAEITLADLTSGTVEGTGVFDVLMKATKSHLEQEFAANRIKGTDYATVYVGSLNAVMQQSVQFLLGKQAADKQADLAVEQAALVTAQVAAQVAQLETIAKQNLKLDSEVAILTQKKLTEQAQILDTVDGQLVAGSVGKQKALYAAQTDGFARDAEQKLMKAMLDTWAVRRTTDEGTTVDQNGLTDIEINRVLNQAKVGIGLDVYVVPPVASFSSSIAGLVVDFTSTSTSVNGAITAWAWNFGDASTATTENPQHTYAGAGTYTVTLTVTDAVGKTAVYSTTVTV